MIVCVCRNIKSNDYNSKEELIARIQESDKNCGKCIEYIQQLISSKEPQCV